MPTPVTTAQNGSLVDLPKHLQAAQHMEETTRDYASTKGIKVENCVGFAKVPVGLAGPLTINGDYQTGK